MQSERVEQSGASFSEGNSQADEIRTGRTQLRKELLLFFCDVMCDLTRELAHGRLKVRMIRAHGLDTGNRLLGFRVFLLGFVDDVVVLERAARHRIKQFLLDLSMDTQHLARSACKRFKLLRSCERKCRE